MSHVPLPAFAATSGPANARTLVVGEAWGESEEKLRRPFVGESGKELFRMLGEALPLVSPDLHAEICDTMRYDLAWAGKRDAWLTAASICLTNVLALRPPQNNLEALCAKKAEVGGDVYSLPAMAKKGSYLRPEFLGELDRLSSEIQAIRPNVVLALGNTACWALLQATNIGSIRGAVAMSRLVPGQKVLATYHPAGVMRNWAWRPIVVADLMKSGRESQFPEIRRPRREVWISPTLAELEKWTTETLAGGYKVLGADCETQGGQISCISFARSRSEAMVVPFLQKNQFGRVLGSFWTSVGEELAAWGFVRALLESDIPKVFQNGLYDYQYIFPVGIRPRNLLDDTMLLHHSKFPELQKGLGFMGSIYTDEASWKLMRKHAPDTEKRDE